MKSLRPIARALVIVILSLTAAIALLMVPEGGDVSYLYADF